ncbi:glycosyltransferase [Streptomyces virginiae]|uniref:glycosyltransferase n=1 Tax=Streptomyces virginiae TaxID=1961 RepID=UPI003628AA40
MFPRTAAVVHHAGAGTTAAGLRAGTPAVAVPVQLDQHFWAQRLRRLGVSPPPLRYPSLTAPQLSDAIVSDRSRRSIRHRNARRVERVHDDAGVGREPSDLRSRRLRM